MKNGHGLIGHLSKRVNLIIKQLKYSKVFDFFEIYFLCNIKDSVKARDNRQNYYKIKSEFRVEQN